MYLSAGWSRHDPSNLVRVIENATLSDFALLTSAMHMAWLRHIGGRLKSDYRYSIGLVYNTFPLPPEGSKLAKLEPLAQAVLDARTAHPGATLADLYDPDLMPPNLRKASSGPRPRRRPAVPAQRLRLRTRARRASVRVVREDDRTVSGQAEAETPPPSHLPQVRLAEGVTRHPRLKVG